MPQKHWEALIIQSLYMIL